MALSIAVLASSLVVAAPAVAGVCLQLGAGLLGRWPADGSTADVAHGRDGTLVLGTTYEAGTVNQAFSFDGGDDQVSVPDDPDWTIDGDFTIDTWVTMDDLSGESKAFVGQSAGQIAPKWIFWRRDDGQLGFLYGDGVSGVDTVMYPSTPTLGQWYHVAVAQSGTTFTLYVDGAQVASATSSAPIVDVAGPLTLGSAQNEFFLEGALDQPEIYQRAFSGAEIDAIQSRREHRPLSDHAVDRLVDRPGNRAPERCDHLGRHARALGGRVGGREDGGDPPHDRRRQPHVAAGCHDGGRRHLQLPGHTGRGTRLVPRDIRRSDQRLGGERLRDRRGRQAGLDALRGRFSVED